MRVIEPAGAAIVAVLLAAGPAISADDTATPVLTSPGRIEGAGGIVPLGSAVEGLVAGIGVAEGDRVRAGQVLATIDCRVIQGEAKVREQELGAADAVFRRTKAGYRVEEIAIAAAAVKAAEATAEEAQTARQRAVALRADNTATQARIDIAERDARTSAAQLEQARQQLAMVRSGSRIEDIEEASARRDAASARLGETRAQLELCAIRSPTDGVVVGVDIAVGQFVSSLNQPPLLRIVDDSKHRVRAEVDPNDFTKLCIGQHVMVVADGDPEHRATGTTVRIGAVIRPRISGDAPGGHDASDVTVSIDQQDVKWPIGLPVHVQFSKC